MALIHAALAFAFLNAGGTLPERGLSDITQLIDISPEPPPPPVVELVEEKAPEKEGAAAPPNIESQATPVAAPKPRIALPVPPPIPVTETPRQGSDPTQGAAPVPGPGTGAGGVGTGTGAGGSGSGTGGGGQGQGTGPSIAWPPYPYLSARDYPRELSRRWPRGGRVFTIFRVQVDGRATDCRVDRSFGDPEIDAWTCRLIETRLRFNPARRPNGEPYASYFGYAQEEVRR